MLRGKGNRVLIRRAVNLCFVNRGFTLLTSLGTKGNVSPVGIKTDGSTDF
jgi:hypothetical protein